MEPTWPGVVCHIHTITAAVGSRPATQMDARAAQHGKGSLASATYFQMKEDQ